VPSTPRILIALLIVVTGALLMRLQARDLKPARWPTEDAVFSVPGWTVSIASVDDLETAEETRAIVERQYTYRLTGQAADFVIWTEPQPQAKTLFRKGADRDLLGAGYTIEPAPDGLVPPIEGGGALVARQGDHAWLALYTFGERRGRLGDGFLAWSMAETDALLDAPNDYFLARLLVPFDENQTAMVGPALELSRRVFENVAIWYQRVG
jgi:hypothetical protein